MAVLFYILWIYIKPADLANILEKNQNVDNHILSFLGFPAIFRHRSMNLRVRIFNSVPSTSQNSWISRWSRIILLNMNIHIPRSKVSQNILKWQIIEARLTFWIWIFIFRRQEYQILSRKNQKTAHFSFKLFATPM